MKLFEQYEFPNSIFDHQWDRDYTSSQQYIKKRGRHNYYPPIGWIKYGLRVNDRYGDDLWLYSPDWSTGFYSVPIQTLKRIVISGNFSTDEKARQGTVYLTPFINHLQDAGRVTPVQRDPLGIELSDMYRVVLQCKVRDEAIHEHIDPAPCFMGMSTERPVWQVPVQDVRPYSICIKKVN